jgi:hypothetical protein
MSVFHQNVRVFSPLFVAPLQPILGHEKAHYTCPVYSAAGSVIGCFCRWCGD